MQSNRQSNKITLSSHVGLAIGMRTICARTRGSLNWSLGFFVACLLLSSCCNEPEKTITNLIAEQDGCKIYEIIRSYHDPVYFTTCGNTSWDVRKMEGKVTRIHHYQNQANLK